MMITMGLLSFIGALTFLALVYVVVMPYEHVSKSTRLILWVIFFAMAFRHAYAGYEVMSGDLHAVDELELQVEILVTIVLHIVAIVLSWFLTIRKLYWKYTGRIPND